MLIKILISTVLAMILMASLLLLFGEIKLDFSHGVYVVTTLAGWMLLAAFLVGSFTATKALTE